MVGNVIVNTLSTNASAIFCVYLMDQRESPCCHNIINNLTANNRYHSKEVTSIGALHFEEIGEVVLVFVFTISFPVSL